MEMRWSRLQWYSLSLIRVIKPRILVIFIFYIFLTSSGFFDGHMDLVSLSLFDYHLLLHISKSQ